VIKLSLKVLAGLLLALSLEVAAAAVPLTVPDLLSAGRMDEALRSLNGRVQAAPNDAEAYHLLSRAYFHLKKWDQAISSGEKAVELDSNKSDYYLWLARAYGEKAEASNFMTAAGLVRKIRGNFEKAVALNGANVDARTDLAEFYVEAPAFMGGGTDKAAAQAQAISQHDAARAHWVNAKIAEKKKDNGTAEREYQAAITADPDADYWLNLASFYRRNNRYNEMDAAVTKAIAANRKKTNSLFDAATLLLEAQRNLPIAASLVRNYLTLVPTEEAPTFEAHYVLGQILEKQGDKKAAAVEYRASLSLASNYSPAQEALKRVSD
jgi:tetratricopeptide (TPR) repeat protein